MLFLDWESLGIPEVAVDLLKERYGRKELMFNARYLQIRDLPTASTYYGKLKEWFTYLVKIL